MSPGYPDWLLFRPRWVLQVEGLPGLSICLPLSSRQTEHLSISADPLCPSLWGAMVGLARALPLATTALLLDSARPWCPWPSPVFSYSWGHRSMRLALHTG